MMVHCVAQSERTGCSVRFSNFISRLSVATN